MLISSQSLRESLESSKRSGNFISTSSALKSALPRIGRGKINFCGCIWRSERASFQFKLRQFRSKFVYLTKKEAKEVGKRSRGGNSLHSLLTKSKFVRNALYLLILNFPTGPSEDLWGCTCYLQRLERFQQNRSTVFLKDLQEIFCPRLAVQSLATDPTFFAKSPRSKTQALSVSC